MDDNAYILSAAAAFFVLGGCKTSGSSDVRTLTFAPPEAITLQSVSESSPIDSRPFQFWLHAKGDSDQILATNRSKGNLVYVSKNKGINIAVSKPAIQCMGEIFRAIEQDNIKSSPEWTEFKAKHPYRFLEQLPELRDFYSFAPDDGENGRQLEHQAIYEKWSRPVLWNGFKSSDVPAPGQAGFKLRGYLKWVGVLLPDGKTCLITARGQVQKLLQAAMRCEEGENAFCQIPTEE